MKFNSKRILGIVILFVAASVLVIPASQMAFANPLPGVSKSPPIPVVGGTVTLTITPTALTDYPVSQMKVVVFESGLVTEVYPVFGPPTAPCLPPIGAVGTLNKWLLEAPGGIAAEIGLTSGVVTLTYGSGGAVTVGFTGVGSITPAGPYTWVDKNGAGGIQADNLGLLTTAITPYRVGICGYEAGAPFDGFSSIFTQLPVAGEILPINTMALLIAGVSSNALWMLPTLATVAGVSFVLLRFQVTKKNN